VDVSALNGALAGFVVLVAAVWGNYIFNRLWQITIEDEAGEALEAAREAGLKLIPAAYRPRRVAKGRVASHDIRVEWRGGLRGLASKVYVDDTVQRTALIRSKQELMEAIGRPGSGDR